jgi:signal transduction histidine kinase
MIGVGSLAELVDAFAKVQRADVELDSFVTQFVAIWDGKREIALDLAGLRMDGQSVEAVLHWSAPPRGSDLDLERVIVTISDITPRKVIEDQLTEALESNRRLLDFEHALASCARALLLGSGEGAMEVALEILRAAIGADRAFLTINMDDEGEGESFRIESSVSTPEFSQDDWVGRVIPWDRYAVAYPDLKQGRPYQHLATDQPGEGWNRSVLAVPVSSEERWIGTVGFIDIARRTEWTDDAVRMLEVAAPILGTFWEREMSRRQLEDLVQSKDRFVASVSHELRTPLAAVLGFAEAIRDNADSFRSEELTDMLELIADQSQEMANMVEDLLVSARADIGTVSIRPQYVYLRSQAEAVLAAIGPVDGHEIRVVGGPGKVWADPSRTRQILRNLLTNAIRYGGRSVEVEAVADGEAVVLTVKDDGPGLAESEWTRIFEPYQRAHDTPTQPASIGLGLTVSRQLARLMGGDLFYERDHEGSKFILTLPVEPLPGGVFDGGPPVQSAG